MFFGKKEDSEKEMPVEVSLALRLKAIAQKSGRPFKFHRTNWTRIIRFLLAETSLERVNRVFLYLESDNCELKVASANWLRENFVWVESKALDVLPSKEDTQLTAEERVIYLTAKKMPWLVEVKGLDKLVSMSVNNLREFYHKLKEYCSSDSSSYINESGNRVQKSSPLLMFARHYLAMKCPPVSQYVIAWIEELCKMSQSWSGWKGGLAGKYAIVVTENEYFRKGCQASHEYCGKATMWRTLLKHLGYEVKHESSEG
jgi:hypothetical protein